VGKSVFVFDPPIETEGPEISTSPFLTYRIVLENKKYAVFTTPLIEDKP
jgi:hypothetical protein